MRHEYDVFEKFPDGSTLWCATVLGRFEAIRKIQELREHSVNEFYAIDVVSTKRPRWQRSMRTSVSLRTTVGSPGKNVEMHR